MSTSSGREKRCGPCGHFLDGHAHARDSKCKKCKKIFDICQVLTHRGWRICFIPCSCGKEYYPDKARAAVPLASHEYDPSHPGYRALTPDDDEYDTIDQASSSTAQGGSMGHNRTDSTDSDPLGWSTERYQQETGSIDDELVGKMKETHIGGGSVTAWSEWEWKEEHQQWRRYRMSHGKYEYEWRASESSTSSTSTVTAWSEWEWKEEHQQWRRYRMSHGEYEYEWRASESSTSSTSSTSKKESIVTAWSEWEWKEEYQQWRRYRMSHGEYEYEWRASDSSTSSTSKPKERTDTDWSEWELDEEHQRWCRGRWLKGKYVIEWDNPEPEDNKGKGKGSSHKRKDKRH